MRYDPDAALDQAISDINELRARLAAVDHNWQVLDAKLTRVERVLDAWASGLYYDPYDAGYDAAISEVRAAAQGEGRAEPAECAQCAACAACDGSCGVCPYADQSKHGHQRSARGEGDRPGDSGTPPWQAPVCDNKAQRQDGVEPTIADEGDTIDELRARLAEVEAERDGLRHRLDIERGAHRGARARLAEVEALCDEGESDYWVPKAEVRAAARGEGDRPAEHEFEPYPEVTPSDRCPIHSREGDQ